MWQQVKTPLLRIKFFIYKAKETWIWQENTSTYLHTLFKIQVLLAMASIIIKQRNRVFPFHTGNDHRQPKRNIRVCVKNRTENSHR